MTETFVKSFTHLKDRPKADQALPFLQRVASLVKPIMRKHSWVLPVLSEFFPDSPNLVGLNINHGQKILLRLRPPHAPDTFYDEEQVVGVMLHELTHNVHGPHDDKFYKFLADLEAEYDALKRSGYAGEGFFSEGHRVGTGISHNLPPHLARQKAMEAAEKRRKIGLLSSASRLGGTRSPVNKSPRQLAAEAAERRARDEKACGSGQEALREAERAAQDSIENKVIDLTQDSEPEDDIVVLEQPSSGSGVASSKTAVRTNNQAGISLKAPQSPTTRSIPAPSRSDTSTGMTSAKQSNVNGVSPSLPEPWSCPQCTLINEALVTECAACMLTRPNRPMIQDSNGWICQVCGETGISHQFWSCSFCGSVKSQS